MKRDVSTHIKRVSREFYMIRGWNIGIDAYRIAINLNCERETSLYLFEVWNGAIENLDLMDW